MKITGAKYLLEIGNWMSIHFEGKLIVQFYACMLEHFSAGFNFSFQ
jgi:hypothetical protein